MKNDIKDRKDIELLVFSFYEKVKNDAIIGYFFTDVMHVNWEAHLPTMYDFWENILFHTGNYSGNPMLTHKNINQKSAITAEHFQHWITLFYETMNELFEGEKTEQAKQRALSIATVMQIKIFKNQL